MRICGSTVVPASLMAAAFLLISSVANWQTAGRQTENRPKPNMAAKAEYQPQARKIPCKTPENASSCYWTHGRLAIANGNPSWRIWKIGTHRMLGVFNGPSHFPPKSMEDDESPELPLSVSKAFSEDRRRWKQLPHDAYYVPPYIFADLEVCPLELEKEGEMQSVCLESAKNLHMQSFNKGTKSSR